MSNLKRKLSWLAIVESRQSRRPYMVLCLRAVLRRHWSHRRTIGAGIAYLIRKETEAFWKREYSVKIAETVYGALYSDVKGVVIDL